jgi:hypothetical protein
MRNRLTFHATLLVLEVSSTMLNLLDGRGNWKTAIGDFGLILALDQ